MNRQTTLILRFLSLTGFFLLLAGWTTLWSAGPSLAEVDIFSSGEGGYHTYRIPAVVRTDKGTLLAFCEGRRSSSRDWGDIDLLLKRSRDDGKSWSDTITVADLGADTIGNPAPVIDHRTKTIWLLLTRNPGDVPEKQIGAGLTGPTRTVWITHSRDDGLTWAAPMDITAAVKQPDWTWYATGPVNGIQLQTGRLLIPCDHDWNGAHYSHLIYSDDGGSTWKLGGTVGPGCNESTVAELADGSLMLNMRSYASGNRRTVATSRDGGLTWSKPFTDPALIEPVCQATLIAFGKGNGRLLLFANPADTRRINMTVRLSSDEGKSWTASRTVFAGPSAYSNLVELKGKSVGLLYERGNQGPYERITFARFSIGWIKESAATF
jgi:sialidase-1